MLDGIDETSTGGWQHVTDAGRPRRKKLRVGHVSERDAVNFCRALLERHGLVVHEVDGRADYGRDLLVDITEEGELTGLVAAIQVKGDRRFVREGRPWVLTASARDAEFWAGSNIPVFGVLKNPETSDMRWGNLTQCCRQPARVSRPPRGEVVIEVSEVLDDDTLAVLIDSARTFIRQSSGLNLLDLLSPDVAVATRAVADCFAVARTDERALELLRRSLMSLEGEPLRCAIVTLSHVAAHPDIAWSQDNWLPEVIQRRVQETFRWSAQEIVHLLRCTEDSVRHDDSVWRRGDLGQCLWHMLAEDDRLADIAVEAIALALSDNDIDSAFRALTLAQASSSDPGETVQWCVSEFPGLARHHLLAEYVELVDTFGFVAPYE